MNKKLVLSGGQLTFLLCLVFLLLLSLFDSLFVGFIANRFTAQSVAFLRVEADGYAGLRLSDDMLDLVLSEMSEWSSGTVKLEVSFIAGGEPLVVYTSEAVAQSVYTRLIRLGRASVPGSVWVWCLSFVCVVLLVVLQGSIRHVFCLKDMKKLIFWHKLSD